LLISFDCVGRPVPQGSMTASYNRKQGVAHVHHVQGTALALWRAELREAAANAGAIKLLAPLFVTIHFGIPRPKFQTELKRGQRIVKMEYYYARPAIQPDLDKLIRAVLDALTGVCYDDDAQVVMLLATKQYGESTHVEITDEIEQIGSALTFGLG